MHAAHRGVGTPVCSIVESKLKTSLKDSIASATNICHSDISRSSGTPSFSPISQFSICAKRTKEGFLRQAARHPFVKWVFRVIE
jgi:hypothetical protein